MDNKISRAIHKGHDERLIARLALERGMKSMIDDGLMKLDQVTISEIIRMVPHEMIQNFRSKARKEEIAFEDYYLRWLKDWEKSRLSRTEKIYYVFSDRPFFYHRTILSSPRDHWDRFRWERDIFEELYPQLKPVKAVRFSNGDPALIIYEVSDSGNKTLGYRQ